LECASGAYSRWFADMTALIVAVYAVMLAVALTVALMLARLERRRDGRVPATHIFLWTVATGLIFMYALSSLRLGMNVITIVEMVLSLGLLTAFVKSLVLALKTLEPGSAGERQDSN